MSKCFVLKSIKLNIPVLVAVLFNLMMQHAPTVVWPWSSLPKLMSQFLYHRKMCRTSNNSNHPIKRCRLHLDGVKVFAAVIRDMAALQSVSGWLPNRDKHKLTIHTPIYSHTEHALQPIQYLPLSVSMETDMPPIDKSSDVRVSVCILCALLLASARGGVKMCICISEPAVCGDE